MTPDRRHGSRLPTELGGTVVIGEASYACSIANLSLNGALLVGDVPAVHGQEIIVIMALEDGSEPFPIWAVVVRVEPGEPPRFGVQLKPSHRAHRRLERFVEAARAVDPAIDSIVERVLAERT